MTLQLPWSGRDVNGLVPMSGRAAVRVPQGTGFNWPSLSHHIQGYARPGPRLRGLGQPDPSGYGTDSIDLSTVYQAPSGAYQGTMSDGSGVPTTGTSSSSQPPWWANILGGAVKTGSTIASYELNPLYQKQTYVQTPQGLIYATNQPTSGIPGLNTATAGSIMPLLLIGGVVVVFMMMAKR